MRSTLAELQKALFNSLNQLSDENISQFFFPKDTREEQLFENVIGATLDALSLNNEHTNIKNHVDAHLFFIKYTIGHLSFT